VANLISRKARINHVDGSTEQILVKAFDTDDFDGSRQGKIRICVSDERKGGSFSNWFGAFLGRPWNCNRADVKIDDNELKFEFDLGPPLEGPYVLEFEKPAHDFARLIRQSNMPLKIEIEANWVENAHRDD
jgi:hypothetical protein